MRKWLYITMLLLMTVFVSAQDICEDKLAPGQECEMMTPSITCSTYNYNIMNDTEVVLANQTLTQVNGSVYKFTFNQTAGSYLVILCDGSTREIIVEADDEMSSLSITLFVLISAIGLIILPFIVKRFAENEFVNMILRRSCWVVGIYLMGLNAAMVATIAGQAGIPLTDELFRYMWLFTWGGYVLMFSLAASMLITGIKMWQFWKKEKRGLI